MKSLWGQIITILGKPHSTITYHYLAPPVPCPGNILLNAPGSLSQSGHMSPATLACLCQRGAPPRTVLANETLLIYYNWIKFVVHCDCKYASSLSQPVKAGGPLHLNWVIFFISSKAGFMHKRCLRAWPLLPAGIKMLTIARRPNTSFMD